MTEKQLQKMIDETAARLGEHFDAVRIFANKNTDDGEPNTVAIDSGSGNFYAQLGQVQEWLSIQEQYQRNWAIRKDAETE